MTSKRLAKRRSIIDSAAAQFSARGYHATRMQDIAEALDMQAGSLYYYFPSKEALLTAIVESSVGVAVERLGTIVSEVSDPVDRVRRGITEHLAVFEGNADLYSIFNSEKLDVISAELADQVNSLGRKYEDLWVTIVRDGVMAGAFRHDLDPWLTMKAIVAMCNATLIWFSPGGALSVGDVAEGFSTIVLEGLRT